MKYIIFLQFSYNPIFYRFEFGCMKLSIFRINLVHIDKNLEKMSSVAVYSSRSRASERQRNIRNDMNRASAYIMNNDYKNDYASNLLNTSSTLYSSSRDGYSSSKIARRPRDSSLGALGRPNRDSSLTRTGTYTRDSSLPRFKVRSD